MQIDEEDVEIMQWEGEGGAVGGFYYHRHTEESDEGEESSSAEVSGARMEHAASKLRIAIENGIASFDNDRPDTDYQKGYLAALVEMLRVLNEAEGLDDGSGEGIFDG